MKTKKIILTAESAKDAEKKMLKNHRAIFNYCLIENSILGIALGGRHLKMKIISYPKLTDKNKDSISN